MVEVFGNARAQDTNSACYEVPTFVPLDPLVDVVQPPITNIKSAWDFNHPIVGKLLCPLQLLPEYEADPMCVSDLFVLRTTLGAESIQYLACSRTKLRTQQFSVVPMTKETGHHFSSLPILNMMSMNLTRVILWADHDSSMSISLLHCNSHCKFIFRLCKWFIQAKVLPLLAIVVPPNVPKQKSIIWMRFSLRLLHMLLYRWVCDY